MIGLAGDMEEALVATDDTEDGGQAEAASGELGGMEGFEHAADDFLGHAAAGILDFDGGVVAWLERVGVVGCGEELAGGMEQAGMDGDGADLVMHGFGSIDGEVHEDLLELGGVGEYWGQVSFELEVEGDFFTDGELDKLPVIFDELGIAFLFRVGFQGWAIDGDHGYEAGLDMVFEADIDAWGDTDIAPGPDGADGVSDLGDMEKVKPDEVFLPFIGFDEPDGEVFGAVMGPDDVFVGGVGDFPLVEFATGGFKLRHFGFRIGPSGVGNEGSPAE